MDAIVLVLCIAVLVVTLVATYIDFLMRKPAVASGLSVCEGCSCFASELWASPFCTVNCAEVSRDVDAYLADADAGFQETVNFDNARDGMDPVNVDVSYDDSYFACYACLDTGKGGPLLTDPCGWCR